MRQKIEALMSKLGLPSCMQVAALSLEDREHLPLAVRFHLRVCPGCKCFHEQIAVTAKAVSVLPNEAAPEDLKRNLLERLRQVQRGAELLDKGAEHEKG